MKKILFGFFLVVSLPVFGSDLQKISESLLKLRADVEQLDSAVNQLNDEQKLSLKTLKVQQGELSASIEAEKLRRDQLKAEIKELQQQLSSRGYEDQQMKTVVINSIESLKEYVDISIPFYREKRIEDLAKLKSKVQNDEITSAKAAIRLWSFVEDELRAAKENTVLRQKIEFNGETHLAEVAKLGNLLLFFKTQDGSYGYAKRKESGWSFERLHSKQAEQQLALLFESLQKQIRTGQFQIPNTLKESL